MTLSTEFFRLRDSPEGSSSRRLIIIGAVGVACLLLFIHHIRLEVAARPSSSEVAARNSSSEEATVKRLKYLESRYEALAKSLGWKNCGGAFHMKTTSTMDLVFEVPPNGLPHGCVWIIASKGPSGPLQVKMVQDDHFHFSSNFSLRVVQNPAPSVCNAVSLRNGSVEQTFRSNVIMIFFHGQSYTPGEGFRLKITDGGPSADQKRITFFRQQNSFTHRYPPGYASQYGHNEMFLLLGEASQEKRVNVTISGISTESGSDWVTLMYIDPSWPSTQMFCQSGTGERHSNIQATIPAVTPFLIFFRSDGSVAKEGFNVRAMYYD